MQTALYLHMRMERRWKVKKKLEAKIGGTALPRTLSHEVYDTEVHCEKCGTRLYVSSEGASLVLASLKSMGIAGLVCLCGHTQFIDAAFRPYVLPMQNHRHD